MAKINSICEALAFNLQDEEINKLGYDGYEAFDKLTSVNGKARNPNQPLINLISDEYYTTDNLYQHGEHNKNYNSKLTALEMLKKEQEEEDYTNMLRNIYFKANFPFSFHPNYYGYYNFANVPLTANKTSKNTRIFNGAIVPAYIGSENETELYHNYWEWFIGSEKKFEGLNSKVNSYSKVIFDVINVQSPYFSIVDIRKESNNFIMTISEFIAGYDTLNDTLQDNAIGILVDDSVDKNLFRSVLTNWDMLSDESKTVEYFYNNIQSKYTYYIYFKSDTVLCIAGSATYLDIDSRHSGQEYPIAMGYLNIVGMDFSKIYSSRLGQAGFHPRFLTKLLHSQIVILNPKTKPQPGLPNYIPDEIDVTRVLLTPRNSIATLTIKLGKTIIDKDEYPNTFKTITSSDALLNITKVTDLEYTINFLGNTPDRKRATIKVVTTRYDGTDNIKEIEFIYTTSEFREDDDDNVVTLPSSSGGDGGGSGGTGSGGGGGGGNPPGGGPGPDIDETYQGGQIDWGRVHDSVYTEGYNNSGYYGEVSGKFTSLNIEYLYKGYILHSKIYTWMNHNNSIIPLMGDYNGFPISRKELVIQYNYLTNYVGIYDKTFDISSEYSYTAKGGEAPIFEDYTYKEKDELKYDFVDSAFLEKSLMNENYLIPKYVKRKHFKTTTPLETFPTIPMGEGLEVVNLKALGTITDETTNDPNVNNIYLTPTDSQDKIKLGSYDPKSTKKRFITEYLPIEWEVDDIPFINKEGINDEVKGMFFIPGRNWLKDATEVYAPIWVQNPGIYGSLEGKVKIGDLYYKVTSIEEGSNTLRFRTDIDFENINTKVSFAQTYPLTMEDGYKFEFGEVTGEKLTINSNLDKRHAIATLSFIFPHTQWVKEIYNNRIYRNDISYNAGFYSINPKDSKANTIRCKYFDKDTPPNYSLQEITINSMKCNATIQIPYIRQNFIHISTRLPYQSLYKQSNDFMRTLDSIDNTLIEEVIVKDANT